MAEWLTPADQFIQSLENLGQGYTIPELARLWMTPREPNESQAQYDERLAKLTSTLQQRSGRERWPVQRSEFLERVRQGYEESLVQDATALARKQSKLFAQLVGVARQNLVLLQQKLTSPLRDPQGRPIKLMDDRGNPLLDKSGQEIYKTVMDEMTGKQVFESIRAMSSTLIEAMRGEAAALGHANPELGEGEGDQIVKEVMALYQNYHKRIANLRTDFIVGEATPSEN